MIVQMNASTGKPLWDRFSGAYLSFLRNLPPGSFLFVVGLYICSRSFSALNAKQIFQGVIGLICVGAGVLSYFANGYELLKIFEEHEKKKKRILIFVLLIMMVCLSLSIDQALLGVGKLLEQKASVADH
jgi:accessory gene regulator protein AgrB